MLLPAYEIVIFVSIFSLKKIKNIHSCPKITPENWWKKGRSWVLLHSGEQVFVHIGCLMGNKMLKGGEYVIQLKRGLTTYFVLVKEPFPFHDHSINIWICMWTLALSPMCLLMAITWESRLLPKSEVWVQSISTSNIQRAENHSGKIFW